MGSAQWHHSFLTIHHARWSCIRERRWPPRVQGYHVGGFSYIKQLLDILRSFIFYGRRDVGSILIINIPLGKSSSKLGWQPLKLGWPLGRPLIPFSSPGCGIQARIEQAFRVKWCHLSIFGDDYATIVWRFLPPLYFLDFFNVWWGCCLPPLLGVRLDMKQMP
jgi:hypothetical protein